MNIRTVNTLVLLLAVAGLLAGCANSPSSQDSRNAQRCPTGQILVCKGGDANSRVKDSKLNETDGCICQPQDRL